MQLNKWSGSDKPKKDDFNSDNQKIDEACRAFSQNLEQLEASQNNFADKQTVTTVSGSVTAVSNSLTAHTGNSGIHVTAAEKSAWSKSADLVVGSYNGNGASTQKVTLGYQPQFGMIFAVGDGLGRVAWTPEQYYTNAGCISKLGCSLGLSVNSDGFTVEHISGGGLDGFSYKFNASGIKYVYFIWK